MGVILTPRLLSILWLAKVRAFCVNLAKQCAMWSRDWVVKCSYAYERMFKVRPRLQPTPHTYVPFGYYLLHSDFPEYITKNTSFKVDGWMIEEMLIRGIFWTMPPSYLWKLWHHKVVLLIITSHTVFTLFNGLEQIDWSPGYAQTLVKQLPWAQMMTLTSWMSFQDFSFVSH